MDYLEVFSKFFEAVLVGLLPVLAVFLIRWAKLKADEVLADIEESKPELMYHLEWIAGVAVTAAEQSKLVGFIEDKRKYAFDLVANYLAEKGIAVDIDLIYAAIEAEVKKQFPKPA